MKYNNKGPCIMICEECNTAESTLICHSCDEFLCEGCTDLLHRTKASKSHIMLRICNSCRTSAFARCMDCKKELCLSCLPVHVSHTTEQYSRRVALYWDYNASKSSTDFSSIVQEITGKLGAISVIKNFGMRWGALDQITGNYPTVDCSGTNDVEILIMDMASVLKEGLTDIFVITDKDLEQPLLTLKEIRPSLSIFVSPLTIPLVLKSIDSFKSRMRVHTSFVVDNDRRNSIEMPLATRRTRLMIYMKNLAYKGQLTHSLEQFVISLAEYLKDTLQGTYASVNDAMVAGEIFISQRQMPEFYPHEYVGMQLLEVNIEALFCTLRSLKADQMLPTESIIISRIKEAFNIKMNKTQWNELLKKARNPVGNNHAFDIRKVGKELVIFPMDEEWTECQEVSEEKWKDFIEFIREFFKGNLKIPGSRYGCVQFTHIFGPPSLQSSSIGEITCLVQRALDERLLKYVKHDIVWAPSFGEVVDLHMLTATKACVVDLAKQGILMSQLPALIKQTVSSEFEPACIGYSKLKHFIEDIEEVQIVTRNKQMYLELKHL